MFTSTRTIGVLAKVRRLTGRASSDRFLVEAWNCASVSDTRSVRRQPPSPVPVPRLSGAAALRALFARGRLLQTLCLWIGYAAMALVLHLFLNWLPVMLVDRGVTASAAAGVATLFNMGGATGGLLIGLAIDRLGPKWPLASVFAALVAVLVVLAGSSGSLATLSLLAFAAGLLIMAGQFGLYAIGPWYYADEVRGAGVGAAVAAGRLGSVIGPVVAGQMLGAGASGGAVVLFTAPIVIAAAVAALTLTVVGQRA